jgi:hypothetical protein
MVEMVKLPLKKKKKVRKKKTMMRWMKKDRCTKKVTKKKIIKQ